jgi:hypothetical protein
MSDAMAQVAIGSATIARNKWSSANLNQPLPTILTAALGVSGLVMIVEALRRADSAEAIILGVFGMVWAK